MHWFTFGRLMVLAARGKYPLVEAFADQFDSPESRALVLRWYALLLEDRLLVGEAVLCELVDEELPWGPHCTQQDYARYKAYSDRHQKTYEALGVLTRIREMW